MPRPSQPVEVAVCDCGSAWFEIQPYAQGDTRGMGAVSVDGTGTIIAMSGIYVCIECGERLVLPQEARSRLSLVAGGA